MDNGSLDWFKMQLENRFHKAKRDQFQQLVCEVLERRYPGDFKRIRQGTKKGGGDGGCDGFRSSTGAAYAVYAPRETSSSALKKKIEGDLEKAKNLFGDDLKEWVFVHNDADGLNSDEVLTTLGSLKSANANIEVGTHMSFQELWDLVREMPFDRICDILPRPPSAGDFDTRLPFERLRPVIEHLQKTPPETDVPLDPVSPKKLEYNKLPTLWADYFQLGRRLSGTVDQYLAQHPDPELADKIASGFRSRYASLRDQAFNAAQICAELYEFAGGYYWDREVQTRAAVSAVMAYFFDRCDIFENAPGQQ